jgi:hypothetical protein
MFHQPLRINKDFRMSILGHNFSPVIFTRAKILRR